SGIGMSRAHRVSLAARHGRPVAVRRVPSHLLLSRRGVLHENQWTTADGARDRAEASWPRILEGPLPMGIACRRRPQPGDRTESLLVRSDGEAVPRSADEAVTRLSDIDVNRNR